MTRFQEETFADAMLLSRRRKEQAAEPFYAESEPCEDCGRPVPECACNEPDEPVCLALYPQLMAAKTVRELSRICRAHKLVCAACGKNNAPASDSIMRKKAA